MVLLVYYYERPVLIFQMPVLNQLEYLEGLVDFVHRVRPI
jgi:hypothetical protein